VVVITLLAAGARWSLLVIVVIVAPFVDGDGGGEIYHSSLFLRHPDMEEEEVG